MSLLTEVEMPPRIAKLPRNHAGYPVPFFTPWIDGKPDFRLMDEEKIHLAMHHRLCWICGEGLGRIVSYVAGPMCAVNRISAEPPSHTDCAEYSAKVCPFMTMPKKERREGRMPEEARDPAGVMIARNPGVSMVWTTRKDLQIVRDPNGGILFSLPDPTEVSWWSEGREATREEVEESVKSGLPILLEADPDDRHAKLEIERRLVAAITLFPEV